MRSGPTSPRTVLVVFAVAVVATLSGCQFPDGTLYACAPPPDECPSGFRCVEQICVSLSALDSGSPDDDEDGGDGGSDGGDGGEEESDGGDGGASDDGGSEEDGGLAELAVPETWILLHRIDELTTDEDEYGPTVTADQLTLCFHGYAEESVDLDILCASRPNRDAGFGPPVLQPASQSGVYDLKPELSADGTELFFSSLVGTDDEDIFRSTLDAGGVYTERTLVTELLGPSYDVAPDLGPGGLTIYFQSDRHVELAQAAGLWVATRSAVGAPFGTPERLAVLESKQSDTEPAMSADGKYLVFTSERDAGSSVGPVIWRSVRQEDGGFGTPEKVILEGLSMPARSLELAPDHTLYFSADPGDGTGYDLYVAMPVYDAGQ